MIRLIVGDDLQQEAAARKFIQTGAWASVLAVAEVVLGPRVDLRPKDCPISCGADAVAPALDLFRSRTSLGFSDCLMLEIARKAGHLPLGTFDRALGRVDGAHKL